MTYKDAIRGMQNIKELYAIINKDYECAEMAIEALEKQIPKKPTHQYARLGIIVEGCCNSCEASVLPHMNFCNECGQRLDWSDEE